MEKKTTTRLLAWIGLMSALVFVGSFLRIRIPVGPSATGLHLGNVFCILSGLLLGGIPGGLASGIGSAIFDLSSEYASEFFITFCTKFAMGWVAGYLFHRALPKIRGLKGKNPLYSASIAAILGSLTYTALYTLKSIITCRFVEGLPWAGVWPVVSVKFTVSLANGIIAVIASLILYFALAPALKKAHLIIPQR